MTHEEAIKMLPPKARLSCTFGYPGEPGYSEYWRDDEGRRWEVTNGKYSLDNLGKDFHCRKVEP